MRNLGYNEPQARMTRSSLWQAQQDSAALHAMLEDTDTLPSWVNSKIAVASSDIAKVRRYLDYKLMRRGEARQNPAVVLSPAQEKRLAKAVKRISPTLNREMKSRNKVVASAALQLRALLHEQPATAMAFIDTMLGNLAQTSPQSMKPGQHAFTKKVYVRMKRMWSKALR
jgi:hypothetical protein